MCAILWLLSRWNICITRGGGGGGVKWCAWRGESRVCVGGRVLEGVMGGGCVCEVWVFICDGVGVKVCRWWCVNGCGRGCDEV